MKKLFATITATLTALLLMGQIASATGSPHKVAIHVNSNDPAVMNMALNNAANVTKYYEALGEEVIIEMVAYGPGLVMLIPGKSPVQNRIEVMSLQMENLSFAACGNTKTKMEAKLGMDVQIMEEATVVTSGVVRLVQLQEEGYAYIRP